MVESLYQELRRSHPERFRVGWNTRERVDHQGRPSDHPCLSCVVEKRNPKDCDPCRKNPDRDRMKKAGLL